MSSKSTISIFGSTGGTGLAVLRLCLAASYQCTVMVRSPTKLLNLLSLPEAPSNLNIISGAIRDTSAVERALLTSDGKLVDIIVSCIGMVASSATDIFKGFANVDDKHICEDGTRIIVSAISDVKSRIAMKGGNTPQSPVLVVLSTTGITRDCRDIPLLITPLYYGLLKPPHVDKRAMEDFLDSSAVPSDQPWVTIRPAFLIGGGMSEPTNKKVRVGTEKDGKHETLAVGYTIQRSDVGNWIFKEIVQGNWEKWARKAVTLTY